MRFLLMLCAFMAYTSLYPQENSYPISKINPLLTKNANAVVRLDEMKVEVLANDLMVYEVK